MPANSRIGALAPEAIEALKAKHKSIFEIEVDDPDTGDTHVAYFREPTRQEVGPALARIQKQDAAGAGEMLARACWLDGSNAINKSTAMATALAMEAVANLITVAASRAKKL